MSFGHGSHLVGTVGVEGRPRDLRRVARAAHVEGSFLLPVAHRYLPAAAPSGDRKGRDQRSHHSFAFLRVPVGKEKPSRRVDQKLVELGFEPVARTAETSRGGVLQLLHGLFPSPAPEARLPWVEFPAASHALVAEGLGSLSEGREAAAGKKLLGALPRNGKGKGSRAPDLERGHAGEHPPPGAVVSRAFYRAQQTLHLQKRVFRFPAALSPVLVHRTVSSRSPSFSLRCFPPPSFLPGRKSRPRAGEVSRSPSAEEISRERAAGHPAVTASGRPGRTTQPPGASSPPLSIPRSRRV